MKNFNSKIKIIPLNFSDEACDIPLKSQLLPLMLTNELTSELDTGLS